MKKLLNISLSFLMIFTVAFATIETVDSEPVFANASKAFACKASMEICMDIKLIGILVQ